MVPSGFPTGTVSSGRDDHSSSVPERGGGSEGDPQARIAELERENEALREAVAQQRRENDRIVERYERLLDDCDADHPNPDADAEAAAHGGTTTGPNGVLRRVVGLFTDRG